MVALGRSWAATAVPVLALFFLCANGGLYSLSDPLTTKCELEAISVGTRLADAYNSFDEATDWDVRVHHDYLVEHLGFAGWIQMGLWKQTKLTATRQNTETLHRRGGWAGFKSAFESAYWPLQNKWVYLMGDSTQRQVWATFVSPFQNNDFERNAKEWSRETCDRQFPHRKNHESGGYFPQEGWHGKCGNNEVTCHLPGFGGEGKITFDWKHFPYEDYDEWIFGESGLWSGERHPEVLVVQTGLHTCSHALQDEHNHTMIQQHKDDLSVLMGAIRKAVDRPSPTRTTVIIQLAGRMGGAATEPDECTRQFNRVAAFEAHRAGFAVLEREEIERRLLYKSEYWDGVSLIKSILHLENPASNIVGTSLLSLVGCLERNGSDFNKQFLASDL